MPGAMAALDSGARDAQAPKPPRHTIIATIPVLHRGATAGLSGMPKGFDIWASGARDGERMLMWLLTAISLAIRSAPAGHSSGSGAPSPRCGDRTFRPAQLLYPAH